MDLIKDYLYYQSGNECSRNYHLWSCLSMLAAVSGRRVSYVHGNQLGYSQLTYYTDLFVTLVGPQGSRKTFAKDSISNLIQELFPDMPITADVDTRQAIAKTMADEVQGKRHFVNHEGATVEYHPMYHLIDELVNFLSVDPAGMINFWVNCYNRPFYASRTKNKGSEYIKNPCVNILACGTTEYIVEQLRSRILSGGLARRMLFINETTEYNRIADPMPPTDSYDGWKRVKAHLVRIPNYVGLYQWATPHDKAEYDRWYSSLKLPNDPLLAGFYRSKHVQAIKLTMLHDLALYEPRLLLTKYHFEAALATVDAVEPGMMDLFSCSGRNVLAHPERQMVELLRREGGLMSEKAFLRFNKDLGPFEMDQVIRHLKQTAQIIYVRIKDKTSGLEKMLVMTPEKHEEGIKQGLWK